jgi:hypothetical protein
MANLKTKTCANSVCDNSFKLKSDEKKYCCLSCKNQANYKIRKEVYSWEFKMLKARNNNIQILEYLWNKRIFTISEEELKKFGFDFMAGYMYKINEKGTKMFRYGNIGLQLLSATEVKLTDLKKINL